MRNRDLPLSVRWWLWRHRKHGTPYVNRSITVSSFDVSARGILTKCPCGESGAW